jgi:uncharacterized cupredoxin-like copper-binding protein
VTAEGKGVGHIVHAKAGETAQGGLRIKEAGSYRFWCTVSGYEEAGMVGTITVASPLVARGLVPTSVCSWVPPGV